MAPSQTKPHPRIITKEEKAAAGKLKRKREIATDQDTKKVKREIATGQAKVKREKNMARPVTPPRYKTTLKPLRKGFCRWVVKTEGALDVDEEEEEEVVKEEEESENLDGFDSDDDCQIVEPASSSSSTPRVIPPRRSVSVEEVLAFDKRFNKRVIVDTEWYSNWMLDHGGGWRYCYECQDH